MRDLWRATNLPPRYRDGCDRLVAGEWTWPDPEAVARAEGKVLDGGIVALLGSRGPGKTQLGAWLMRIWIEVWQRDACYSRADDLFDRVRESFSEGAGTDKPLARLCRYGLLVIDEVQDRFDTQFEDVSLTRIVDKRYGAMLPTVLISNLLVEDFLERVGSSIESRLTQTGEVIVCDWPSFRERA